ncbi:MAG TPA: M14 family metallopeptidase [Gemmatimonadales bacterium]
MRIPLLLLLAGAAAPLAAQTTRAERTAYAETSSHQDVLAFIEALEARGSGIRSWILGKSPEGRVLPVVLAARPMVPSAEAAAATGKPIVWIQANIHAGEVEGKEAAQMLLRDVTLGPLRPLLDSVILLVVPIYNADGNEAWAPGDINRPGQNGPPVVGKRSNGQGLDLNRDYTKLEAPETRAAAELIDRWNPHLFIDLHTTNGSYHGYALTWSPGLNPNRTPINDYVQDDFLPEVRRRMQRRHDLETFPYGNFRNQDPDSLVQGWETYDGRGRYGTNWHALRGRMSILSEAYSNDPFQKRVDATYHFVRETLSLVAERWREIAPILANVPRPDSVAVRQRLAQPRMERVIAEVTLSDNDGSHGFARRRRTGEFRTVRMPVWDRFLPRRSEALPAAYLVPDGLQTVVALLRRQGIIVSRLPEGWAAPSESFELSSVTRSERAFEGHHLLQADGAWTAGPDSASGVWWYVTTSQPLGVLAAYLLEPASEDGVVAWNFMEQLAAGTRYPVLRLRAPLGGGGR